MIRSPVALALGLLFMGGPFPQENVCGPRPTPKSVSKEGTEVLRVQYGADRGQVRISVPKGTNPQGPMSFSWGNKGRFYIPDQVNNRIQVFAQMDLLK